MPYADNPPFKAWRIKVKSEGVLFYIVSSTEPVMLSDGTVHYTEVPGYGEHVARIDWATAGPISWWVLDPEKTPRRTTARPAAEPRKRGKGKKAKGEAAPELVPVPAKVQEWAERTAMEAWPNNERERAARVRGNIAAWRRSTGEIA